MPSSRVLSVLIKRGITLTAALIIAVFLSAILIGATGYDEKVLKAIVITQVQAYKQNLQRQNIPSAELNRLVQAYQQSLEEYYGLNKPWYYRVIPLAVSTLKLDLGWVQSTQVADVAGEQLPLRVSEAIMLALPRTIIMITAAELICALLVLRIGPALAYRRGSLADRAAISYAAIMNALPVWWIALIAVFAFGYYLRIAPTRYREVIYYINHFFEDPLHSMLMMLWYAWLPMFVVVISFLGSWLYSVRAIALRVVGEDFVAVARAKGLPERLVVKKYVLRVIAGPVLTLVILSLAGSIGGFIITESIFGWPGMGSLYYAAIVSADSPTILGLIYITTAVYVAARFVLEVLYVLLDPRVRY